MEHDLTLQLRQWADCKGCKHYESHSWLQKSEEEKNADLKLGAIFNRTSHFVFL
jgi:hypothetical protein